MRPTDLDLFKRLPDRDARNQLVERHMGLVYAEASKWRGHAEKGFPVEDAVQEGTFGLVRAIEKFDPERGAFSTYAHMWIYKSIRRAWQDQRNVIRIPVSAQEDSPSEEVAAAASRALDTRTLLDYERIAPDDTFAEVAANIEAEQLHAAIAQLEPSQQEAIRMHWFEDMTYRDIGRELGVTGQAIAAREAKAMKSLERLLQKA